MIRNERRFGDQRRSARPAPLDVAWLVALAVWRYGRVEQRWTARLSPTTAADPAD